MVDGAVFADRYRLIEWIGRGGFADVWRAEDITLGRPVAVKVWTSPASADDGTAARVWQEAREAARLVHPRIARVYDIGADGEHLFLVTELVAGHDLTSALAQDGPLPIARVARIGAQAARILAAAHAQGFVHGGLKPGDVLLTADDTVKLTDFGTAASPDTTGPAVGSGARSYAAYTSPEQAVGLQAGPASDLYALGCVLYELLVGHPPFTDAGDDPDGMLRPHVEDEPVRPGSLRPDIPAELEHAVLRMLAKNPADRPADADRIAEVLQAVEAVQSISD